MHDSRAFVTEKAGLNAQTGYCLERDLLAQKGSPCIWRSSGVIKKKNCEDVSRLLHGFESEILGPGWKTKKVDYKREGSTKVGIPSERGQQK